MQNIATFRVNYYKNSVNVRHAHQPDCTRFIMTWFQKFSARTKLLRAFFFVSQVGKANCDFVRKFLQDEGIPLVAEKLGGAAALRVHFLPHSGTVYVKPVKQANQVVRMKHSFASD